MLYSYQPTLILLEDACFCTSLKGYCLIFHFLRVLFLEECFIGTFYLHKLAEMYRFKKQLADMYRFKKPLWQPTFTETGQPD